MEKQIFLCTFAANKQTDERLMDYRIAYIIYCIRKFGEHFGITVKESFDYLQKYKGIEFLDDCYEAEHTLSFNDAVEDLTSVCLKNGGFLS